MKSKKPIIIRDFKIAEIISRDSQRDQILLIINDNETIQLDSVEAEILCSNLKRKCVNVSTVEEIGITLHDSKQKKSFIGSFGTEIVIDTVYQLGRAIGSAQIINALIEMLIDFGLLSEHDAIQLAMAAKARASLNAEDEYIRG